MFHAEPSVQTKLVRAPNLSYEHTRTAFTPWELPEKDTNALAERFVERMGRHLPRGVHWDPHNSVLLIAAADAPRYDPLELLEHFDFVWGEEFDLFTNELDRRREHDSGR